MEGEGVRVGRASTRGPDLGRTVSGTEETETEEDIPRLM